MDFTFTDEYHDLSGLTRDDRGRPRDPRRLAEVEATGDRFDRALWTDLAKAGVLSAALPSPVGGSGLGLLEQCGVLVELGRAVAPVPYLSSIVSAASAIAEFGTDAQREAWAAPARGGRDRGARRRSPRRWATIRRHCATTANVQVHLHSGICTERKSPCTRDRSPISFWCRHRHPTDCCVPCHSDTIRGHRSSPEDRRQRLPRPSSNSISVALDDDRLLGDPVAGGTTVSTGSSPAARSVCAPSNSAFPRLRCR